MLATSSLLVMGSREALPLLGCVFLANLTGLPQGQDDVWSARRTAHT